MRDVNPDDAQYASLVVCPIAICDRVGGGPLYNYPHIARNFTRIAANRRVCPTAQFRGVFGSKEVHILEDMGVINSALMWPYMIISHVL